MRILNLRYCLLIITALFLTTGQVTVSGQEVTASDQAKLEKESTLINAGDMAPDFVVQMLDGKKIRLSELRGKVVLINFWATWCPPCMQEFNVITPKIITPFKGKDFVLLPISRGEETEVVKKKMLQLKEKGIDFPVGLDPQKSIYSLYATQFIPRNFLINKEGRVVYNSVGYEEKGLDELAKKISELLK
jgi:peroxiredoxin